MSHQTSVSNQVLLFNDIVFGTFIYRHITYINENFGNAQIVFDWCNNPSTNDESWLRETKGALGIEVVFNLDTNLKIKKESFLRSKNNKRRFIELLSKKLEENGFSVSTSFGDVIVMIAKVAVDSLKTHNTVVVGKRADLIFVLCFYVVLDNSTLLYMYEEAPKKPLQVLRISEMKEKLGNVKSRQLLFAHAMGGCGSTSQMFNISKVAAYNKLNNDSFSNIADIFCRTDSSQETIIQAGTEAIVSLYNGKANETLNKLRYRKFIEKSKRGSATVTSKSLPPTEAAAKFHCLRVFYTIQVWMEHKLNPLNFGWIERSGIFRPTTTNILAAPADILSNIRCGCKGDCDSNRCTCFKYRLKCTSACKICAGCGCSNNSQIDDDSESDDDD